MDLTDPDKPNGPNKPEFKKPGLEPDPLYEAQRRYDLSNRADLCDPVLRHHLRLPPLPDPYERLRRVTAGREKER